MQFKITDYVEFDSKGRAVCPACDMDGKGSKKNLSLVPNTDGAYKCFRGHTPKEIRDALGNPKSEQIPVNLAKSAPSKTESSTVRPQKAKQSCDDLLQGTGEIAQAAKNWLLARGITSDMIKAYGLGIGRCKVGNQMRACLMIPIPNADRTAYWQKKRVEPWNPEVEQLPDYTAWKQFGIPQQCYFTNKPEGAAQTWLCEGEWDALVLGWAVKQSDLKDSIAVATFTCGCKAIPPQEQLDRMPGQVTIFYDRDQPGEEGAAKVAEKLGDRARIALLPMPEDAKAGWDISDALNHGYTLSDLVTASELATTPPKPEPRSNNPLRERLVWNDDLIDSAPDYTEWLVQDIFTTNELFLIAAGPRAGKSLLAMTLALAVASGSRFLERPVIQGTVLYVCLEDGKAKIKERQQAQGWSRGLPVVWMNKFKLAEIPHLREIAEELDVRLIVIDTLSRAKDASVSESSAEMSQVLEPLQEMAAELECCILLVHHTGKVNVDNAGAIDLFDTIRGSSAIRAVCRGSMVIAASDRDYRLVIENGWGKHDLRVVLDANTLTWRLLGKWNPTVENTSQKALILDFLRQVQCATLEQIYEATQIPKKSLYEQLSRLQVSEDANEKVVKEGSRRSYTYRLALFNTIQQLNSVLNSGNPEPESDSGYIQQKTFFSEGNPQPDQSTNANYDQVSPPTNIDFVEYPPQTQTEQESQPIQQLFNTPDFVEYPDQTSHSNNVALTLNQPESEPVLTTEPAIFNTSQTDQGVEYSSPPENEFRKWLKIDTAVYFYGIRGERAKIRVPGNRRIQWVPVSELELLEGDSDADE